MSTAKSQITAQPEASGQQEVTQPLWLPAALIAGLLLLSLLPRVTGNEMLAWSVRGAALGLAGWLAWLQINLRTIANPTPRVIEVVVRKQHYVQALVQASVYLYWGYHWRVVYDHAWLLVGQLLFAYAFDMLLTWSRRERYLLGFGVLPIVFSTNLFLWFRDDWFYLQFAMLAVGILGKELVRWQRDGKSTHIFNPSAFTLALFSLALLATGTTDLTWGTQIASTLTLAPHIYVYLFAVGLVVMYFFAITPIAASAAATLFGLSAAYWAVTGVPYFLDSEIPAAVFLGLHLLVTDPSTSPKHPLSKLMFGVLYGAGVFALYSLLDAFGAPTFYDKLLCVPLLNLSVPLLERLTGSLLARGLPRSGASNNLAHMSIWMVFFIGMTLLGKTDGRHAGDRLPFWQEACSERRLHACERLIRLETAYCADNSAWACNELGVSYAEGSIVAADLPRALLLYSKACELRFAAACSNVLQPQAAVRGAPHLLDLRLLLREGGRNLLDASPGELYRRACEHGWRFACEQTAGTG